MKTPLLFLLVVTALAPCRAQWAVVDVANIQQSAMNYAALVEQISNQASQITNQIQQIQQFETQLKRLGNMADVKALVGFPEFRLDLNLPTKIKTWADGVARVDGRTIFGDTRSGVFRAVTPDFNDFDGTTIERDPLVYKPAQGITETVDEFKAVQTDVYARREALKRAIAVTSEAMQAAETEAEQQKLASVLQAQYGQLAAVDSEVALSAAQVQVKAAESTAMGNAQSEAEAEARRRLSQQESAKVTKTFKPMYECLLQYVTENPIRP
jgi:septal ring factor EnvC (AmiA/AmiB activator)